MGFYDLDKSSRAGLVRHIKQRLLADLEQGRASALQEYASDEDTYIRKSAYLCLGRIFFEYPKLQENIFATLNSLLQSPDFKIRQTMINAAGEIGKQDFESVRHIFETSLFDPHHAPRNAVIGSIKKMGEVNPVPVLNWAEQYLEHPDKEIRREICHGIELRGRKHPLDILPLLQRLEWDKTARVRNTLVHVIGQIAYKKGCLEAVITHLHSWENKDLVKDALEEIIDVHYRYRNFSFYTQDEARAYIETQVFKF
ncbi:MAG: HEAT repeat domain-containing protein [Taibaiella sp.]|nr:HEAT repeat domain-containing protein [Taibaiella sp.]